jgi:hypothetical protein
MAERPHERCAFTHAVTYTVVVTYTVAGGARHGTADRRGEQIAARLADAAARAKGVVEVTAQAGASRDGAILSPRRVRFAAANSGHGAFSEPAPLDRYLDADHELALRSLAAANAAYQAHAAADRARRAVVGCRNAHRYLGATRACACVYCDPEAHYATVRAQRRAGNDPFVEYRCVCGVSVTDLGARCSAHRAVELVVLDGDGSALQLLATDTDAAQASPQVPDAERDQ